MTRVAAAIALMMISSVAAAGERSPYVRITVTATDPKGEVVENTWLMFDPTHCSAMSHGIVGQPPEFELTLCPSSAGLMVTWQHQVGDWTDIGGGLGPLRVGSRFDAGVAKVLDVRVSVE